MTKVYIDGQAGTVGLNIISRLQAKDDVEILTIAEELRKDTNERKRMINSADFVFLCLPDDEARRAVSLIDNDNVRVIDASTAHRISKEWNYGFPELSKEQYNAIRVSKRVAVPGCYASGFIALIYPLVYNKVISSAEALSCFGISGYSGAGRSAIEEYQSDNRNSELGGARLYALSQSHKHQPEMREICGLKYTPMFNPIIDDYYSGMIVAVPIPKRNLRLANKAKIEFTAENIIDVYKEHYSNTRIKIKEGQDLTFLAANAIHDCDDMELYVFGNDEQILLASRFDNLGKGASGAAVQCFEIMRS